MPFTLSSSEPNGRTETPGILYRDPAAPRGYAGWYMVDSRGIPVLRLALAEDALTPMVQRKLDDLRRAVMERPPLSLVG